MRLLCVEHKSVWGGGQVALTNVLREWQATRPTIIPTVVCPPSAELAPRVRALGVGCETFDLGAIEKRRSALWNFGQRIGATARLVGLMRRSHTDVVLANGAFSFLVSVFAAKVLQVPIVWWEHNTTLPNDDMLRRMIGWADGIVVVSGAIEEQFLALASTSRGAIEEQFLALVSTSRGAIEEQFLALAPEAREKIQVIYNGVDTKRFTVDRAARERVRREMGWDEKTQVVGTVSRLSPEKGVRYFVEAAHAILREMTGVRFVVVGDGPLRTELEQKAPREEMRFVGAQENVADWLNALDVFVMPSVAEAFGLATVEAMACGLPVVASDVGGLCEIVVEGETGVRVPPQDAESIARAVVALLEDENKRRAFGAAGRVRVNELFTLERQARLLGETVERWQK